MSTALASQETCLKMAWQAHNEKNYAEAIQHAETCIENFYFSALKKQKEFDETDKPCFPVDKVSEEIMDSIFAQGVLNDVAAAFFIKCDSAYQLFKDDTEEEKRNKYAVMIITASHEACKLECGRVWKGDEKGNGFFWSPCEGTQGRVYNLERKFPSYYDYARKQIQN